MNNATIRVMQALVLAATIISAAPAMFAQHNRQQTQPQVQPQAMPQPTQQQAQQQPVQQSNQQPAQAQMQAAPAVQTSWCANRPLCYEANDFVVTVTEFRTSTDGRGTKILDAMLHFQNKTTQPISLGYVDQSGGAIDDMGNRFMVNTFGGGVRGMGVVGGNNMDPKFTLAAGGGGDARLEFWWPPYGKLAGVNYEMEFSIREMNRVEGNQWTLGDESLIHYQGLANGMGVAPVSGGNSVGLGSAGAGPAGQGGAVTSVGSGIAAFVPGQTNAATTSGQAVNAYAAPPCPPGTTAGGTLTNVANAAGAQNQNANNAISNASSAISSIGSLFGHKKNAANPNAAVPNANAVPCTPATNANATANAPANSLATPVANTAVPQTAGSNPLATPVGNAKGAAIGRAASTPTTASPRSPVTATVVTQRTVTTPARTSGTTQQTAATAVTKTSLKQPVPAAAKPPAAVPAKKPATTPAPANGSGGAI